MSALCSAGVTSVVASPGSRSTALVLAAAAEPRLRIEMIVDERSAAFFALGQARVSGRPSVLVCTSGSAAAHYFPAILEAERALLPLIAVTADRPWELGMFHANQAFDQTKLFGGHVKASLDLGEPDPGRLRYVSRVAALAVQRATSSAPGPVHVNARFRKPLEPSEPSWNDLSPEPPCIAHAAPASSFIPEAVTQAVRGARRGLVVMGPRLGSCCQDERQRRAVARFVVERRFLLVAEVTSGVAHGATSARHVLPAFDSWIELACDAGDAPDLIFEIGSPPTSSAWERVSPRLGRIERIVVGHSGLIDPTGTASQTVTADPAEFFERLGTGGACDEAWCARMTALAQSAEGALSEALSGAMLSEPFVVRSVIDSLPSGAALVLGNSSPVRDAELFASRSERDIRVLHQRGLSGIDGLIAGAAGASTELPAGVPLVALIGDVSALHDVGSLAVAARVRAPLTLVVIDNGGGRIFSELPVAEVIAATELERLFLTPPPDFLQHAARAFGIAYQRIETRAALAESLALTPDGARLLHVVVPPDDGRRRRRTARAAVAQFHGAQR